MTLRRSIFRTLVVCGASLAVGARAMAAEEGAAGGPTDIFKWINFAIVAGVLVWFCLKRGGPWFRRNRERISAAITEAAAAKGRADQQLRQAEQRLARLEEEIRGIREEAQRAGAAEADRLRALARSDAEKIGLAAKAEIQAAERAARLELKALAAGLAVDRAERLLATQLTRERQDALVAGFVKSLEGSPN
jgi:F-type H+-transporting ATPase subunit b